MPLWVWWGWKEVLANRECLSVGLKYTLVKRVWSEINMEVSRKSTELSFVEKVSLIPGISRFR